MKRRILVVIVCFLFTLGICSVAYAKGGGGSGGKGGGGSAGNGGGKASISQSSSSVSGNSASGESAEGQAQEDAKDTGSTTAEGKGSVKKQEKKQAVKALETGENEETAGEEATNEETTGGKGPKVRANGKNIKFDVPPVIKEGRTLIPVRAIMNGLGAEVAWDEAAKTVTITRGDVTVVVTLDSRVITVNGQEQAMDVPAQLISNRTFVPIRFIAQALNMNVDWDEDSGTVDIGDDTDNSGTDTSGDTGDGTEEPGDSDTTTDETSGTGGAEETSGGTE
ncbi:MAG: copper amine oxidase N-terminal domain-containing protein [Bacillota bacterium]